MLKDFFDGFLLYLRILQDSRLKLLHPVCYIGRYVISRKTGLEILPETRIGKGFRLVHPYNITINPNANIGCNVNIYKGVTIGYAEGKRKGVPTIGDFV